MLRFVSRLQHISRSTRSLTSLSTYTSRLSALSTSTPLSSSSRSPPLRQLSTSSSRQQATQIKLSSTMPSPASYPTPPTLPPQWPSSAQQITSLADQAIVSSDELLSTIVNQQDKTFESVVRPLAIHAGEEAKLVETGLFMQYISTNKEVRDASVEADKKLQDYSLTALTRLDVYQALLSARQHTEEHGIQLNPEEKRLLDRLILDRERNGLGLEESKRNELLEIKKRIMSLEVDFQKNCNEENGSLLFTAAELDGVPDIEGYKKEGDKYRVTFKTPDIVPVFKFANLPSTRKAAVLGYEGKTLQNAPLLAEMVKLKEKAAKMLGYQSHAEWVLEVKMARTPSTVFSFLSDLEEKLRPLGLAEREKLLKLKKEEHEKRGWEVDEEFRVWDYRYYDRLWTERELSLDETHLSEYFTVTTLIPKILSIYSQLLGISFHPVPRDEEHGGLLWHEEAEMYAVRDTVKDEHLGFMALDLFPRENKYGHAAVWGLIPGFQNAQNERSYPVVAMVANLSKPSPTKPALMKHQDVVTFFHELGHALHGICSWTQFPKFHGTSVARDFVEAPSQMLENWMWEPAVLKSLGKHYLTGEELPDELIDAVVKSKKVNQGLFNLRQVFFARFDMLVHTTEVDADLTTLWNDTREKTSLVSNEGTNVGGQSGFAHIAGGYDAGYYGYLYSQAFSADMYETVFKADPLSAEAGKRYREKILKVGGSRDEMDSLKDFLGREPTNEAFLKSLLGGEED
ncbi:hypothetical protein BCR35DRAFT_307983 [Leucosporidium creatinivorum]|uniref:Peptidase M3A/M3B catalytic domain-containing protein n=1 Tax=Leucosporidium creatinivorum TaxID=106004 RepID=A0A1Y2ECV9_9BASI|nr:hypothetical protein BCR35DRAFT_307983 [Leucosporidium creatinivorum]